LLLVAWSNMDTILSPCQGIRKRRTIAEHQLGGRRASLQSINEEAGRMMRSSVQLFNDRRIAQTFSRDTSKQIGSSAMGGAEETAGKAACRASKGSAQIYFYIDCLLALPTETPLFMSPASLWQLASHMPSPASLVSTRLFASVAATRAGNYRRTLLVYCPPTRPLHLDTSSRGRFAGS
jgi:hypothetical protein